MVRDLPTIRGTQVGLKNPALVDQIKAQMRSGQFLYHEIGCRVIGIRDSEGTYHVKDGHHRMVAAFELYWETGDSSFVRNLITCGRWDDSEKMPQSIAALFRHAPCGEQLETGSAFEEGIIMVCISCEGVTIGGLRLPPFQLESGDLICLHMPCLSNSKEERQVIQLLTGETSARGLSVISRVFFADPPEFRAGILSIFRRPRVGDWLQNKAGISLAQATAIAKALGLETREQICRLEGSPKVRLGLEAAWARGAVAIVFSTAGCEKLPREAVLSHIEQCPAIELSYPFWTQGQRKRECHPRARCIEVEDTVVPLKSA